MWFIDLYKQYINLFVNLVSRGRVPYLNLRIMTPFRASYFYVYLTWEPGEGIADTLGSIVSSTVSFLFIICSFLFSLFRLPFAKGGGSLLQVSDWPIFATLPLFRYFFLYLQQQNPIESIEWDTYWGKKNNPLGLHSYSCSYHWMVLLCEGSKPLISSPESANILGFSSLVSPWRPSVRSVPPWSEKDKVFLFFLFLFLSL